MQPRLSPHDGTHQWLVARTRNFAYLISIYDLRKVAGGSWMRKAGDRALACPWRGLRPAVDCNRLID